MSDRKREDQKKSEDSEEKLLQRMLLENPLFRKTAEGIAQDHGMSVLEAARALREFW